MARDDEQEDGENNDRTKKPDQPEKAAEVAEREISSDLSKQLVAQAHRGTTEAADQFGNPIASTQRETPVRLSSMQEGADGSSNIRHSFYPVGRAVQFTQPGELTVSHGGKEGVDEYTVGSRDGSAEATTTVSRTQAGGLEVASSDARHGQQFVAVGADGTLTNFSRSTPETVVQFTAGDGSLCALQIGGRPNNELPGETVEKAMQLIKAVIDQLSSSLDVSINMPDLNLRSLDSQTQDFFEGDQTPAHAADNLVPVPATDNQAHALAADNRTTAAEVAALSPQQVLHIGELITQLGSENYNQRHRAQQELIRLGPVLLPHLGPNLTSGDLEISRRSSEIFRTIAAPLVEPYGERAQSLLSQARAGSLTSEGNAAFLLLIARADNLAAHPEAVEARRSQIQSVDQAGGTNSGIHTRAESALDELRNPASLAANLRLQYAQALLHAGRGGEAISMLQQALQKNTALARETPFVQALARTSAADNSDLMQAFQNAGGDRELLTSLRQADIPVPETAGASTQQLIERMAPPTLTRPSSIPLTPDQVNAAQVSDQYLTAQNQAQRQAALEALNQQAQNGNQAAAAARDRLPILEMTMQADAALHAWRGHQVPASPAERLAQIAREMHTRPIDRREDSHHHALDLIVAHYDQARTPQERADALRFLRQEVQNGNQSAALALRGLATVDASLRLTDAASTVAAPGTSDAEREQAQTAMRQALRDLVAIEHANNRNGEHSPAGEILNHLGNNPALGVPPAEVMQQRQQAAAEISRRHEQAQTQFYQAISGSGASRQQALARLQQLGNEQLDTESDNLYSRAHQQAALTAAAGDAFTALRNPVQAGHSLIQLANLSSNNKPARDILDRIAASGPAGANLVAAIGSGDTATVNRLLANPTLVSTVMQQLRPVLTESDRMQGLRQSDTLEAFANPARIEELRAEAQAEASLTSRSADDLVQQYLTRDSASAPVRNALLQALPATGDFTLTPEQTQLRSDLQTAVRLHTLTPQAEALVKLLLNNNSINAQQVTDLRTALQLTGAQRQREALDNLQLLSFEQLHLSTQFEPVRRALQSIENAGAVRASTERALAVLGDPAASEEQKTEARRQVMADLAQLDVHARDTHHPLSTQWQHQFDSTPPGGRFDAAMNALRSGNNQEAIEALQGIRQDLTDGQDKANEFRALRIVRNLGPDSSIDDFHCATEQLEGEYQASSNSNQQAQQWRHWTASAEAVSRLSQAGHDNNPEAARQAMQTLAHEARANNPQARAALAAVLVAGTDSTRIGDWMDHHQTLDGKPVYVPNLGSLPDAVRLELMRSAATVLSEATPNGPASTLEAAAVALGLSRAAGHDQGLETSLRGILERGMGGDSRTTTMDGIMEAIKSGACSSGALGDIYLTGVSGPDFARHWQDIQDMARGNSDGALHILAGVSAGMADGNGLRPPVAMVARSILEQVAQNPDMRTHVVDALMAVNRQGENNFSFRDRNQLLATLGRVASDLPAAQVTAEIRGALRQGFQNASAERESPAYASARDGLLAIARHWTQQEADVCTQRLTPDVIQGLRTQSDNIPPAIRTQLISRFQDMVSSEGTPYAERLAAVQAMSSLGKYLNETQVGLLASFGGDVRYNQGNETAEQRMNRLHISEGQRPEFRAACADALLNVLSRAPNTNDRTGPRELAFSAFRDIAWPLRNPSQAPGAAPFIASHESALLRAALVDYYRGRPFDVTLAGEINRIVDSANLPRPAVALVAGALGARPGDRQVFATTDRIIQQYTTDSRSGEEALRQVLSNVQMLNTNITAADRARLLGWDNLPQTQREALGWTAQGGWQNCPPLMAEQIIGMMSNNQLQNHQFAALLGDLGPALEQMRADQASNMRRISNEIEQSVETRRGNMHTLENITRAGASFGSRVSNMFNSSGGDEGFGERQRNLSQSLGPLNAEIAVLHQGLESTTRHHGQLHAAQQVADYNRLINSGQQNAADRLAINMWREHGPALHSIAPDIWHDLTVSSDNTLQGASLLRRQHDRHLTQWDIVPGYASGVVSALGFRQALGLENVVNPNPAYTALLQAMPTAGGFALGPEHAQLRADLETAVRLHALAPQAEALVKDLLANQTLSAQQVTALRGAEHRGLAQLSNNEQLLDVPALRAHMFGRINEDPDLMKVSNLARGMQQDLEELARMFSAAQHGTIYDAFINVAQDKARHVREVMNQVTAADLSNLRLRVGEMETAREQMAQQLNPPANAEALRELTRTIQNYKQMHDLLNRFDAHQNFDQSPVLDANGAERHDRSNNVIRPDRNGDVQRMLTTILDGGLTPSTAVSWLKENGPLIGVTLVAFVATAAAVASCGTLSPAAGAAWFAVAGLAAREATSEFLYNVNSGGYTGFGHYGAGGARVFDWARTVYGDVQAGHFDLGRAGYELGVDVAAPYVGEFLINWGAFIATAGLTNYFSALVRGNSTSVPTAFSQAIFRQNIDAQGLARASEAAVNMASGTGPAASYMSRFLRELGPQLKMNARFTAVQTAAELGLTEIIGRENFASMSEYGKFGLSFALSTGLCIGHGFLHSANPRPGNRTEFTLNPGRTEADLVRFYEGQGYRVNQVEPGRFEVHPVTGSADMRPMIMENAARGEGRPPAALHPEGHPLARAPVEPIPNQVTAGNHTQLLAPGHAQLHSEIGNFTEHFMAGHFQEAYNVATAGEHLPANLRVQHNEVALNLAEFRQASPARQREMLGRLMEDMAAVSRAPQNLAGTPTMEIARPVGEFNGIRIDLITGEPVGRHTPAQRAQVDAARAQWEAFRGSAAAPTEAFRRIAAERALDAMEEHLHVRQMQMGNEPISPSYARFLADRARPGEDWTVNRPGERTAATLEQEAVLALHDQGWSLALLKHHFGRHHATTRDPVFRWLEMRDIQNRVPEAQRDQVRDMVMRSTPEVQRLLLDRLGEMTQGSGPLPANFAQELGTLELRTLFQHARASGVIDEAGQNLLSQSLSTGRINVDSLRNYLSFSENLRTSLESYLRTSDQTLTNAQLQTLLSTDRQALETLINRPADWRNFVIPGLKKGGLNSAALLGMSQAPEITRGLLKPIAEMTGADPQLLSRVSEAVRGGQISGQDLSTFTRALAHSRQHNSDLLRALMDMPAGQRQVVARVLSQGAGDGSISLAHAIAQSGHFSGAVEAGLLRWEDVQFVVGARGAHQPILQGLVDSQMSLPAEQRINHQSFRMLADMSSAGQISPESLAGYTRALSNGALNNESLRSILQKPAAVRTSYEQVIGSRSEGEWQAIFAQGDAHVQALAAALPANLAAHLEPGLFPRDSRIELQQRPGPRVPETQDFVNALARGDFAEALRVADRGLNDVEDRWKPVTISMTDLQNPLLLADLLQRMDRVGAAHGANTGTSTIRRNVMPDVIIELPGGATFSLRNGSIGQIQSVSHTDPLSQNTATRQEFVTHSTPTGSQAALIQQLQNSPVGRMLTARMALTAFEERMVHGSQGQANYISPITAQFMSSPEYQSLLHHPQPGVNPAEALREIDVAAVLYQHGVPLENIQQILGNRHLNGERSLFYEWARRQSRP